MKKICLVSMFLFICVVPAVAETFVYEKSFHIREYAEEPMVAGDLATPFQSVTLVEGALPFGLRVCGNANICGYPTAVQITHALLRVSDANGRVADIEASLMISDDATRFDYQEIPVMRVGDTVSVNVSFQGPAPRADSCRIRKARTFTPGYAARPGARAPYIDAAPSWLWVSPDCVLTVTPDSEAVVLLILAADTAEGIEISEMYVLRSANDPASPGPLETKARAYNVDYQNRFSPNGLTLEIDGNGAYHAYGDSAMWTGTYLAGAAYYYAVTGEDYARANLEKALDATTRLRLITGVPGLIARAYEFDEWKPKRNAPYIADDPSRNSYAVKDGPFAGGRFLSTASRDQFTGVLWGNATVFELFDDASLRARASENITSMAAHLWDNKMHIMDADGRHTRHGVMSGWGIQDSEGEKNFDPYEGPARMANGMNAAMLLNWFNMAANVAPDEAARTMWRDRVMNLVSQKSNPEPGREFEKNYLKLLKTLYVYGESPYNSYWDTAWFNLNLLYNNYFHLVRFEKNSKLRERYRDVMKSVLWEDKKHIDNGCDAPEQRRAGREKNPHFTWQYLAAMGDRDPEKIFDALSELIIFPESPRAPFEIVDPMEIPTAPGHDNWACEPIPIQYRDPSDFQWQRSPYSVSPTWPSEGKGRNFPGVDVITPYWMGRWFGFIPSYL